MRNVILKHGKKVDNFILQNIFKKGLVCAFLFVVFVSINIGVALEWRKIDKDDNSDIIRNVEYEKLYNSVAEGTSTTKTFLLKDDLIDDKYNIKGTAEASNEYRNHVIGLINLGKKSDNTKLQWRIVGNDTEKYNKYDLILQATEPITNAPYNASIDAKTFNGETVWASHYGASDVRALLNDMTSDSNTTYFTSGEKAIMNTTTIGTTNSKTDVKYYLKDKLYLPGGGKDETKIVVGKDNDIDVDGGYFDKFDSWTRSDNGQEIKVAYARYWNDGNDHTIVALEDVTKPLGVKPFVNVDLSSVYFASTAKAATASQTPIIKKGTSMDDGLNLRFNGGKLLRESKIEYNSTQVTYRGKAGQAVVVQGEDSTKDHWYYSKYISSDMTADASITLEEIKTELSLGTDANLEDCNIWIEQQGDDGLIYARLASVEIDQIIYEGISESNRTGFKYSNGTQITREELDKLGISARIDSNEHIITMNGFRVHGSMSDPLHILDSSNHGVMDSVTIELIGNNSIESKGGGAFWSRAEVTFTGTGNLTNIATTADNARGIAVDMDMIFEHTGTIIVYGWEGLRTPERSRDIIVKSGKVVTTGLEGTSCRNLIVNGGTIEASCSNLGLCADTNVTITGGEVKATSTSSTGIKANSTLTIQGATVTGKGKVGIQGSTINIQNSLVEGIGTSSEGIYSSNNLTINGGEVKGTSSTSSGIKAAGTLDIQDGTVTGNGKLGIQGSTITIQEGNVEGIGTSSEGINSSNNITINGGEVKGTNTSTSSTGVKAGATLEVNAGKVEGHGIRAIEGNDIVVNNGDIDAIAGGGIHNSKALIGNNSIVINGGSVYAKGNYYGIDSNNVYIYDGNVEVYENGEDIKGITTGNLVIGDEEKKKNPVVEISGELEGYDASSYQYEANGINTTGTFTMNCGTLNINLKNKNTSGYISGIFGKGTNTVDIKGGTVNIKMNENADSNSYHSDAIHIASGALNVSDGVLNAINDGKGDAIYVKTVNVSGGQVDASVYGTDSRAIYTSSTLNITGGEVNIDVRTNKNHGIYSNAAINIGASNDSVDDTTITINRDNISGSEDNSYGIHASSDINVYEGNITVGTVQTPGFHFGMHIGGTLNVYNGNIISHGYKIGIYTTNMDMQGGYVYAKTTSDGSIRMDRRSIVVTNSFEMSDGYVDVELEGQRGVGLMVKGTSSTTHITGGRIEAEVSGIYTKGMRVKGELKIGTLGTEGPTIIINGDIQNESEISEGYSVNYDESGIYAEKNIEINSGNIKIDMKNSKVRNIDTNKFNDLSNPANNYIAAIMTKQSDHAGIVINGGTIDLNVDVEQPDGSYSAGDGMFTYGHITINGGRITSTTNGGVYWVGTKLYHSSGINAKTDLTITGGEVRAINTNTTYKYNNELIGMGLYSDANIILDGGHIVARGIAQALYVDENHSITSSTTGEENTEAGVITKFGSFNYNGKPLIEYDTSEGSEFKNKDYKYVEIGVRHPYYLRYNVENNIIYKGPAVANGDGTFSDVHFGTGANDSKNILATMGFTFYEEGEGEDKTKVLKLKNAMFESYTKYGLYIEGDAIIELEKNSYSRIIADRVDIESDSESDGTEIISAQEEITDRYGIYITGNITFRGEGELSVGGQTSAIVSKLSTESAVAIKLSSAKEAGTDYDVVALEGSKESTLGVDVKPYPDVTTTEDWNFYKYVRIGSLPVYYFKYDAANNKMYKMVGDSGTVIDKNEVIYGWEIADNVLTLNNFEFRTSANCALEVVGAGTINIRNNCSITTQYISSGDNYGIKSDSSLTLMGTGKLGLQSGMSGSQGYIGIHCADDMSITGGKHYIYGQKYGIYVGGDNFTVNNTTVEATASSTSETSGAIHLNNGTTCDVYECVKVADNVAGTGAETITDYEDEYATYNTKKYIKMEPAVVSVTITWGDMAFVGENVWEPESHTYKSVIKPSVAGSSDLIKIYNDENAGSNVPVKASVNVNIDSSTNSYGIVGKLDNGSTSIDNIVGVGRDLTSKLTLNTTQLLVEGTSGNVGTVSVILKDYRKE